MSNRQRGDYLERQTRLALERYRWLVVRAGGSLGPADLIALRAGRRPLLIQCKVTNWQRQMPRVDPDERQALWDAAQLAGARAVIATRLNIPNEKTGVLHAHGGWVALLDLPGPNWTQYPLIDEIKVPTRPGKGEVMTRGRLA